MIESATKSLYVPMEIEAFVVNSQTPWQKDVSPQYARIQYFEAYKGLGYYLEESPLMENPKPLLGNGVHLHWTLPEYFRRGKYNAILGELTFPLIPNRWAVFRFDENANMKAWVIESDTENENGILNWLEEKPKNAGNEEKALIVKSLGKSFPLEEWEETAAEKPQFLTIMSPANPEFAAAYIHSRNVLGFYDDLAGVESSECKFDYLVVGWFANQSQDPFAEVENLDNFWEKLAALSWELNINKEKLTWQDFPKGMLCHAMIQQVHWQKDKLISNIPSRSDIHLGIGNGISDALAALLKTKIRKDDTQNIPQKLSAAFQYNTLEKKGIQQNFSEILQQKMHNKGFYSLNGGTHWLIEKKEKNQYEIVKTEEEKARKQEEEDDAPVCSKTVSDLLNNLNLKQQAFDKNTYLLQSYQEELYAQKFRQAFLFSNEGISSNFAAQNLDWEKVQTQISERISFLKNAIIELDKTLKSQKYHREVKENLVFPTDYTGEIVQIYQNLAQEMAIDGSMKNYELKEVPNPTFFQVGDPTIIIDGLNPAEKYLKAKKTICRSRQEFNVIEVVEEISGGFGSDQPGEQTTYISPENIPPTYIDVTKSIEPKVPIYLSNINASLYCVDILVEEAKQLCTTHSNKNDLLNLQTWQQPWNPIYMEWSAKWVDNQSNSENVAKTLYGRSLFSLDLANKINELNEKIQNTLGNALFERFSPVAQSLSGFNKQLINRYNGIELPILSAENSFDTDNQLIANKHNWQPRPNEESFFPLGGGAFEIENLRVIDAFGQIFNLIGKTKAASQTLTFAQSAAFSLTKPKGNLPFALPPRIMQGARLRFDWVSARHADNRMSYSDMNTTPICGWLLWNKLNNSIEIFEAEGEEVGELQIIAEEIELLYFNAQKEIQNLKLKKVVEYIASSKTAFETFMQSLKNLEEKAIAKASRQNMTMGLPVGFPIAVASAQCELELYGNAVEDFKWSENAANHAWKNIPFPFSLGDANSSSDGLLGYFVEDNFANLCLPQNLSQTSSTSLEIAQQCNLTLLLDPRMSVNVNMPMLPYATYELPKPMINKLLKQINARMLVTSLITPIDEIKMPLAQNPDFEWKWFTKTAEAAYTETPLAGNMKDMLDFKTTHAIEGWLKLQKKKN